MADPVLAADEVGVDRSGEAVLRDVSLSVDAGTRLLVQGQSGSGKTTLFQVLGLLEVPDRGTVSVHGSEVSNASERERARLRREAVGFVFQEFHLIPDLTARKNAAVPQDHAGERDSEWLDTLFERLDIDDSDGQLPATLSGGEKQRVGIARALANRPDVVLADEPTGQLDPETSRRVLDLLFELQADTDTALIVVSHNREVASEFERTVRLEDGMVR